MYCQIAVMHTRTCTTLLAISLTALVTFSVAQLPTLTYEFDFNHNAIPSGLTFPNGFNWADGTAPHQVRLIYFLNHFHPQVVF